MLNLNFPTILLEILNFLVLSALLYRFLFKPVMRRVETRAAEKRQLLRALEQDREEAAQQRRELEERLARIDEEVAEILEKAHRQIETERRQAVQAARDEAERIVQHARAEAQQAEQHELAEFRGKLLDAVLDISGVVIGQAAPPEVQAALFEQINDRVWELGRSDDMRQVETLRRSLGEREPIVHAVSARELSPDQQRQLARTFSALADRDVNLELETDPALAIGLRVRIGDLIVDNSVAGHLSDLREEIEQTFEERVRD